MTTPWRPELPLPKPDPDTVAAEFQVSVPPELLERTRLAVQDAMRAALAYLVWYTTLCVAAGEKPRPLFDQSEPLSTLSGEPDGGKTEGHP